MIITSNMIASFSAATTTPSMVGNARRFLNSKPVYIKSKAEIGCRVKFKGSEITKISLKDNAIEKIQRRIERTTASA